MHLVWDGRDVALSLAQIEWGSRHIPKVARDWRWATTIGRKVGTVLGPRHYLEIRYEDLVARPSETLGRVCEFLHEEYRDEMLSYHGYIQAEVPRESLKWHRHSVKPVDAGLAYRWKERMSVADRILFEQEAGDALELFGYERERRASTWSSRVKGLYFATARRW